VGQFHAAVLEIDAEEAAQVAAVEASMRRLRVCVHTFEPYLAALQPPPQQILLLHIPAMHAASCLEIRGCLLAWDPSCELLFGRLACLGRGCAGGGGTRRGGGGRARSADGSSAGRACAQGARHERQRGRRAAGTVLMSSCSGLLPDLHDQASRCCHGKEATSSD
jgi:hypothetical protein